MAILLPNLLPALAALAAVLGLVLLAARWARSSGWAPASTGRRLAVLDSLALDRARRLQLIRCDGRELLVLTGGGTDLLVGWLPGPGGAP